MAVESWWARFSRRWVSVCLGIVLCAVLGACTPKPPAAEPVAQQLIDALAAQDVEEFGQLIDDPSALETAWQATWEGLQAEAVTIELTDVSQQDNSATAAYQVHWQLPRERDLRYDATMVLSKTGEQWRARFRPAMIHPDLGAGQHLELRAVDAQRASVVSSDGVELLRPGIEMRVLVDTAQLGDPRRTAEDLARLLNRLRAEDEEYRSQVPEFDPGELRQHLAGAAGTYSVTVLPEHLGRAAEPDIAALSGVRLNEEPALVTATAGFASDILSRVRRLVADELDGINGWRIAVVNHHGAALRDVFYQQPDPSPAIRVGLDYQIQQAAETAVNLRPETQAMIVAMRPSTGEILAVAQTREADRQGDLALQGQFPPGSVFKIITAGAGVHYQGLGAGSVVGCPGTLNLYGRVVVNYNSFSLGAVPMETAFARSCNTTFAEISTNLAPGELADYAKRFGLGVDYDIPGLNSFTGYVPEGLSPLERTEAGYGQGYDLASPLGFALVSATVAAGHRPTPTLVSSHATAASEEPAQPEPAEIDVLRTMMRSTVTSGTAAGMRAGGVISGKTGEAEISQGSHAWFAGFRDDDIAFATLVPLGGGSQASVALTDAFFIELDRLRSQP